jgi:hypothetical protein
MTTRKIIRLKYISSSREHQQRIRAQEHQQRIREQAYYQPKASSAKSIAVLTAELEIYKADMELKRIQLEEYTRKFKPKHVNNPEEDL